MRSGEKVAHTAAKTRCSFDMLAFLCHITMALATALELGAQPLLFRDTSVAPLYFPFHWGVTIPAMLVPHLLVMGPVEAIVAGLVVAYLRRSYPQLLPHRFVPMNDIHLRSPNPLWVGLCIIILLTPLGLLAAGPGLTERVVTDMEETGWQTLPRGLERFSTFW